MYDTLEGSHLQEFLLTAYRNNTEKKQSMRSKRLFTKHMHGSSVGRCIKSPFYCSRVPLRLLGMESQHILLTITSHWITVIITDCYYCFFSKEGNWFQKITNLIRKFNLLDYKHEMILFVLTDTTNCFLSNLSSLGSGFP